MRKKRRTELIVETHQLFVVRKAGDAVGAWCKECAAQVRMIMPEQAAGLACVSQRTIYRWVEAGKIHFIETPEGGLLVCLQSLGGVSAKSA